MAWFKLHTDIIDDPKLAKLTEAEKWRTVALMAFAKELDDGGKINKSTDLIAWRLRIRADRIKDTIDKLIALGVCKPIVTQSYPDRNSIVTGISFTNWDKRNYSSDYLRLRKHRQNKKNDNARDNGDDNALITTDTDTDTDTDTEEKKKEKETTKTTSVSHDKIVFDWNSFSFQNITPDFKDRARERFPALDIEMEIKKAEGWLETNPRNRKKNYERFLHGWFSRAQDRAPRVSNGDQNPNVPKDYSWIEYSNINSYRRAKAEGKKNITLTPELKRQYPEEV